LERSEEGIGCGGWVGGKIMLRIAVEVDLGESTEGPGFESGFDAGKGADGEEFGAGFRGTTGARK
jgi:hypothetical protein